MLPVILQNKRNRLIATGVIALVIITILILLLQGKSEFTDNAYLKADIVVIRPKVTGYITKVLVTDNQVVKAGQVIAQIDDRDYKLKFIQAQENVNIARSKINALVHQIHIRNYEANNNSFSKDAARASLERATKDLNRAKSLIKDQAISQTILDKNKELQNNSENAYATARSNLESSKHKQEIAILERDEAKALLKTYEANFELAKIDLENTKIIAATDGRISQRALQVGQLVSPNMALAYLVQKNIWVLANFKEVQIGKMHINQSAIITIDSFPSKKFKARVHSLSPATGAEFSILPPENATGNFTKIVQRVPVKIVFDNDQDVSLLKPGLSCEVKVNLNT